jgi:septum formation protein
VAERLANSTPLILASASKGRASILRQAGLRFTQQPAHIDERSLEGEAARGEGRMDAGSLAMMLAASKAVTVSRNVPQALVIGADQMMECGGAIYHKPSAVEAAREQLLKLRGRTHSLHAGLAVARGGDIVWRHLGRADLTMRAFSDAFLDDYLNDGGDELLQTVGVYRVEGPGVQLFSEIKGDYFTIIGLPLLPLLGYLRECGWLAA